MDTEHKTDKACVQHALPAALFPLSPITVIVGHYGVGKTNLALNCALDAAALGQRVTLIDLDVVNPYFRSSDYAGLLEGAGVRLIAPVFAGTTLDSPSLSGAVGAAVADAFSPDAGVVGGARKDPSDTQPPPCVIIDAGGDDVGSTALGAFARGIAAGPYDMLYVVNRYRNLTQDSGEAAALLGEIEAKSRLRATGIVNNSHLKQDTGPDTVRAAQPFAREVARLLSLPLVCTAVPKSLAYPESTLPCEGTCAENVYPVQVFVRTPWGS